jgi:AI-2 transport protein TqsA
MLIGAGSAVLVVAGLRWASGIVGPTFLAIVLTVTVYPLRRYPLKRGWPAWSGPLVGIVAVYALLLSLTAAMVLATARFATLLPQYESDFNDLVQSGTAKLKDYGVGKARIECVSESFDASQFVSAAEGVLQHLLSLTSSLFFVVTLLLFLGIDATHFPEKLNANREDRPADSGAAPRRRTLTTKRHSVSPKRTTGRPHQCSSDLAMMIATPNSPAPAASATTAFPVRPAAWAPMYPMTMSSATEKYKDPKAAVSAAAPESTRMM